ncbi:hypothetical protein Pint_33776 [Pistacia integerrima]|uniref:Uncharacterized protein n=1 Tax=Pistacia integerrima TaxID=434235 RepID=A0ACC0X609_9ROSI|nr:hypothetical protein Pint_33776 [Pistacia integerrima]
MGSLNFSRIDTLDIKALILKKIGQQRGESYFDQLSRFFSFKISKSEFDKFCITIIGRQNIPLHNKFIKSIIRNVCVAKVWPPTCIKKVGSSLNVKTGRSMVNRDRKFRDHPSPLGPLGKPQSIVVEQQSATELLSLGSRPPVEVISVEDGEEVEQSRSPVTAPLGICMNFGGARKSISNISICLNSAELPDTRSLRSRLERKLAMEGISVSVDCVNLLNNGLDVYLKRLIGPCIGLASFNGMRYMQRPTRSKFASMLDFRTAMELDPKVLGEDWAIQRERICFHASEE